MAWAGTGGHRLVSDVGYAAALVLAAVFAWAGVAKLARRQRTTATFTALGLPGAPLLGTALPVAEVLLAVALVTVPGVAAYAALALITAFTTFLVRTLRRGVPVACGCFGSASVEPVSGIEVVRNLLLGVAALAATAATGPGLPSREAVLVVAAATVGGALALADARRRTTGERLRTGR
jgi:hypothetical protein